MIVTILYSGNSGSMLTKKIFFSAGIVGLFTLFLPISALAGDKEKKDEIEKKDGSAVDLLSKHETQAVFKGIVYRTCLGRTILCPDRCPHSGEFAEFIIKKYTNYEKPGEYGDARQKSFMIQISDTEKKPLGKTQEQQDLPALIKTIKTLKEGEAITLNWNHNYVETVMSGGVSMSSSQRTVTKLEKLPEAPAKKADTPKPEK